MKVLADGDSLFVSVDSISGRGGARRVRMTISMKTPDSTNWTHSIHADSVHWKIPPDSTAGTPDSNGYYRYWKYETVVVDTPTTDSTRRASRWYDPFDGINYDLSGWYVSDSTVVKVCFVKVVGDPTLHYGYEQRALLRIKALGLVPAELDSILRLE